MICEALRCGILCVSLHIPDTLFRCALILRSIAMYGLEIMVLCVRVVAEKLAVPHLIITL